MICPLLSLAFQYQSPIKLFPVRGLRLAIASAVLQTERDKTVGQTDVSCAGLERRLMAGVTVRDWLPVDNWPPSALDHGDADGNKMSVHFVSRSGRQSADQLWDTTTKDANTSGRLENNCVCRPVVSFWPSLLLFISLASGTDLLYCNYACYTRLKSEDDAKYYQ